MESSTAGRVGSGLEIRLFGPPRVLIDGEPVEIRRRQLRAVLIMLSLEAGWAVPSDTLIEGLWGDRPPPNALHTLHVYVSRLRSVHQAIREALATVEGGYALQVPHPAVDLVQFEDLIQRARRGQGEVGELVRQALALWIGVPLLGFQYEEFSQPAIRRVDRLRVEAIGLGARAAMSGGGSLHEWASIMERELAAAPGVDELWALLVDCYTAMGAPARADDARWRRNAVAESRAPSRRVVPARLVAEPGLIGRDNEIDDLVHLVGEHRLVTIVGPPGVGKSRLARQVVAHSGLPGFVVEPLRHPGLEEALAAGLGLPALPGAPTLESLARLSSPDDGIVVIDDCEQLVDEVARFVGLLGRHAPNLTVLATSRVALSVAGERLYPLEGLNTSHDEVEGLSDAARLLSVRRADGDAEPEMLEEIVERLDGMPLAIEIVAAALAHLTPAEVVERITHEATITQARARGVDERFATMEGSLAVSLQLVGDDAALVLRRLAQAERPISGPDAEHLVPELDHLALENALDELVAHSLVRRDGVCYRMLWVVAAFARTAGGADEEADRAAHASWVRAEVERFGPDTLTGSAPAAHRRLDDLALDVDRALEHCLDHDREGAVALARHLAWHWHVRGNWPDRLEVARAVSEAARTPAEEVEALFPQMLLEFDLRDHGATAAVATRLVDAAERSSSDRGTMLGWAMRAALHSTTGDRAAGLEAAAQAQALAEALQDPFLSCVAWFAAASVHLATGTPDEAIPLCENVVATPDAEPTMWAAAAFVLAGDARRRGEVERAQSLIDSAVSVYEELGELLFRPLAHLEQAMVHRIAGRPLVAIRGIVAIFDEALRSGDPMIGVPALETLALLAKDLDEEESAVMLHAAALRRDADATWGVNPWVPPEAADLDDLVSGGHEAAEHGRLASDDELRAIVESLVAP